MWAGLSRPVRWLIVVVGALVLAGIVLINPIGKVILVTPTEGGNCEAPASTEGLDFRSVFNSENQLVNGSMIRSLRSDPSPDCRRIGDSYRCTQDGPTTVEVRLTNLQLYYEVPDGAQATIFGHSREVFCVMNPAEDAR